MYNPSKRTRKCLLLYCYSLLLLFVPFRKESKLVPEDETPKMAFNVHVVSNVAMQECHNKFLKALECLKLVQELNKARAKDPDTPQD